MTRLATEGIPQMIATTLALGLACVAAVWLGWWPAAVPLAGVWIWSIAFFRDPPREAAFKTNELCAPADGTITDITELERYEPIDGPAVRIGIFLSLFNVHINRAPCAGVVRSTHHNPGKFFAAMKPKAWEHNESNALVIDPHNNLPGPVVVRQVAGMAARRIVCHAKTGVEYTTGQRFGLIKYGSRTELIVPNLPGTRVHVTLGDRVQAGVTLFVTQALSSHSNEPKDERVEDSRGRSESPAAQTT